MRLALALVLAAPAVARADQCQWLEDDVADRAQQLLEEHPHYATYCAPCGDKAPGEPAMVGKIERADHSILIDGRAIDLAYTYVEVSDTAYASLAALAGCPTTGVPPSLRVDAATASGVMIRASDEPADPPSTKLEEAQTVALASPEPTEIVVVHDYTTPAWLIALLAGGATSGAWAGLLLARRRRRRFEPRALELR